jgi:predicted nuclease with TOPRIM domain
MTNDELHEEVRKLREQLAVEQFAATMLRERNTTLRAALDEIAKRVTTINLASRRAEHTDLDEVWDLLYHFRNTARSLLRRTKG